MNFKLNAVFFFLAFSFFSCQPEGNENPMLGTWEWVSGSREILPSGFERLHKDRSPNYLVGDAEYDYTFNEDGTFESTLTPPGMDPSLMLGSWNMEGNSLFLDVTEPQNFKGITQYEVPFSDNSNLDLQWSVQYLEFSDTQIEELSSSGVLGSNGWTVDKDSLLAISGTLITSVITLHFEK